MQRSRFEPTFLNFSLVAANQLEGKKFAADVASYGIHNLPLMPQKYGQLDYCNTTKRLYNPREEVEHYNQEEMEHRRSTPPPGFGTQDQYAVGDLSGKLQNRNKNYPHNYQLPAGVGAELSGLYWDVFLPLQGSHSILHRSLVIKHYNRLSLSNRSELKVWHCVGLIRYQTNNNNLMSHHSKMPIFTAEALFRYPIVGRVLFRQPLNEPWQDTSILFEYLIHADGSVKDNTDEHRWAIHTHPPGQDFYSWQNRCLSTGDVYNPFHIQREKAQLSEYCKPGDLSYTCPVGALNSRLGRLKIAGGRQNATRLTRFMYTDTNLPLSGQHSILGKSLVIYDDNGPVARGERLACAV